MKPKTDPIDLGELKHCFLERIRMEVRPLYEPLIESGAIKVEEAEEETQSFYRHKLPVLQTIYSYHASQWSRYYEMEEASDTDFWHFLTQAAYRFSRDYHLTQLNVPFYIEQFQTIAHPSEAWNQLREVFLMKWKELLSNKEYLYELDKIDELCQEYYRSLRNRVSDIKNSSASGYYYANRLAWIKTRLGNAARRQIEELIPIVQRNPIVKEVIHELGLEDRTHIMGYKSEMGLNAVPTIRHARHSDIVGVTEGNNLNSLLPVEYCYMSDRLLEPLFMQRLQDNKLQVFDYASKETKYLSPTDQLGGDCFLPEKQGPFVVCIDTSGSMKGQPELIEKAIILAAALVAGEKKRKCVVVLFSEAIETIEITDLFHDITRLEDFLLQNFIGGTDITEAVDYATMMLDRTDYSTADLLMMSDFQLPPLSTATRKRMEHILDKGCRVYSLAFGETTNDEFLQMSHKVWYYN